MPRPKRAQPFTTKELSLPTDLCLKVDLALFSPLEGKVPYAAWQRLLTSLLTEWVKKHGAAVAAQEQQP